jgi:hypothetical protein
MNQCLRAIAVMRERWIIVGRLKANVLLMTRGMHGRGYWINWQGRDDWCAPNEFFDMPQVEWAVRRRLGFAGLELLAMASHLPRNEFQELWVLVCRQRDRARLYLKRKYGYRENNNIEINVSGRDGAGPALPAGECQSMGAAQCLSQDVQAR